MTFEKKLTFYALTKLIFKLSSARSGNKDLVLCEQGQYAARCVHEDGAARIGGVEVLSNLPEGDTGFHGVIYAAISFLHLDAKKENLIFGNFIVLSVSCPCSFCKDKNLYRKFVAIFIIL